ncbi:MAG TPA: tetratricopeptide repeat protein [Steroidobacteraceae bacterium]|jgi:protein O-GlcNAc transferase|nr:tetratricopeptide repeat protein [Steroidobacteraceae bacterium]
MAQHLQSQSAGLPARAIIAPPPVRTPDALCGEAMSLQLAGRLDLAERLYREILQMQPAHAAANYCIGMLQVQNRRASEALPFLLAALKSDPKTPDYWLGYLEALLLTGQTGEALAALALGRQHGLAGVAVEEFAGRLDAQVHRTTAVVPVPPPSRTEQRRNHRLASRRERTLLATLKQGRFADALNQSRSLTEDCPERGLGWKTLGALLWQQGHLEEALAAMRTAAQLLPQDAETHANLGMTLTKLERFGEAETCLRRALDVDPQFAAAHGHLADMYQLQGMYTEAEACLRRTLALRPDEFTEGVDLRRTSLLFMLMHNPATDADALFAEHCRVGAHLERRLPASWPRHRNVADPNRCLKVGIVSGDLRDHAVATFIEPVFEQLRDHPGLELHAYHNHADEDRVTARLRSHLKHWHRIVDLSDTQLAQRIMDDRIDILIDLSGHTSLNRLRTFARKPAPVQVSWIGYPGTTGLRAMDYYLGDPHFLPPGQFDRQFTEKLVYLPAQAPFRPSDAAPPVNGLPALETGTLTFGSFNRLGKITAATVDLWSQLLRALPATKMLIAGTPPGPQPALIKQFAQAGISPERLTLHPRSTMDQYLALHHQVDLCLDTYPYAGGTTNIHAVWMGVPTLTVAGPTPAARQGAATLSQVGLDGFTAGDAADFVVKGVHWANHLSALAEVRLSLRGRLQESPSRRAENVAAALEWALRHMWVRWCAGLPAESFHSTVPAPAGQGSFK